jgi:putative transposase
MTRSTKSHIREVLTSLFSSQFIRHHAAAVGAVRRRRKVDIVALVYTLVLAFDRGARRNLSSLRRAYAAATGTTLAPSAFYDRFTPALTKLMKKLAERALAKLAHNGTKTRRAFGVFVKLLIADGSLVRLPDALERHYPSVWTNHTRASAKLHVIMNGTTRTPESVRVAPGSSHDLSLMTLEGCCIGSLYVFDLAYYQGKLFRRIIERGGHFLCRVKKDANFRIVAADDPRWVGRRHRNILSEMRGRSFEVWIDYAYRHLPERDWTWRRLELRLIAVWDPELQRHRLYLTSAPRFALPVDVAAEVYAVRWEIELLFRELKSQLRVDHMPSGNKAAAECMLYASLLALAFDRILRRDLAARTAVTIPAERSSILFRSVAPLLLDLLVGLPTHRAHLERRLRRVLRVEAPDPNRRPSLPDRARAIIPTPPN